MYNSNEILVKKCQQTIEGCVCSYVHRGVGRVRLMRKGYILGHIINFWF